MKKICFSSQSIRMSGKKINFNDKKFGKSDFYKKNKKIINIDDTCINKILVSKKESYGKYNSLKYFIGYNDNDDIRPLCLKLSKMTGYVKKFEENKSKKNKSKENKFQENMTMSLRVNNEQLLKKYNVIWKNIET